MSSSMDIPVSRLNQRMALQLPAEFPLGMVFVVGIVDGMDQKEDSEDFGYFFLEEEGYRVRCLLSKRASMGWDFGDGDKIRVGGHLAFDPQRADYYLLSRDIEILTESEQEPVSGSIIMADINRRSEETGLVPAELPVWVKQLAPPELMAELGITGPFDSEEILETGVEEDDKISGRPATPLVQDGDVYLNMSDELINFLSMAMDSTEEIELTPEVIAHLGTPADPEMVLKEVFKEDEPELSESIIIDDEIHLETSEIEKPIEEPEEVIDHEMANLIEAEKNGSGPIDTSQNETVVTSERAEAHDVTIGDSLALDLEMDDSSGSADQAKSSTPWPEIVVIALIIAALFLSFAVVYIVAAR
ncbi:MAG TPA: hypothetical protein VFI27_09090 [candidate division Zixibacteria bacterium]|nr:hypothetical protein [candidate division Zixibacteria bacterium]